MDTACVLDVCCASIAPTEQGRDGTGRLREIKGEEACESARRRTFAQAASPVLVRNIARRSPDVVASLFQVAVEIRRAAVAATGHQRVLRDRADSLPTQPRIEP